MRAVRCALVVLACALHPAAQAQTAGQWRDSAHLWQATCAHCHGSGVAPSLFGKAWSKQVFELWVRSGPGAMPTFSAAQIGDGELAALARWVSLQPAPTGPRAPQASP